MEVLVTAKLFRLDRKTHKQVNKEENMKRYLGFAKQFLLVFTPVVATSALASLPSQAASLAFSQENLKFTNFSENFSLIERQNQANILASPFSDDAVVVAENIRVQTNFIPNPPEASTSVDLSFVRGIGSSYLGTADTLGKIVSNFDVDAGKLFSFEFTASLNLGTLIEDGLPTENANAFGDISFFLFDTSDVPEANLPDFLASLLFGNNNINRKPLEYFSLTGNVNTFGNNDFLKYTKSQNIIFNQEFQKSEFGSNEETATASIGGYLKRSFDNKTNLTLVATRQSKIKVAVPEPSTYLGSLLFSVLIAIYIKAKRKAKRSKFVSLAKD
ncbi:MAG: hypothetical protein N2235_06750 [Fischerella sp.]|nr:hypothetical protein [Fischerella sp.]